MADVFTKQKRSEVMAKIRARGNKQTELVLMGILRRHKISGWRRHKLVKFRISNVELRMSRRMRPPNSQFEIRHSKFASIRHSKFGSRPDFVFPKERVAVFVDGCFWHGCPKHFNLPASNRAFWRKKLSVNKTRDQLVNRRLRAAGWRVVRIWEHELREEEKVARRIRSAPVRKRVSRLVG